MVTEAQNIHRHRFWTWTYKTTKSGWRAAVAIASLPGLRSIRGVEFITAYDTAAATLHNQTRGLNSGEAHRIGRSVKAVQERCDGSSVDAKPHLSGHPRGSRHVSI